MLRALRYELRHASSFTFSVAFVSARAIALLKQELVDFEGVGRIITSNYLGFNSPAAFSELLNLRHIDIDVRLHPAAAFHPKGYVFEKAEGITAILGSSNLTEGALARNHEWNLRVSASRDSDLAEQFTNLLDAELFNSVPLTQEWITEYAKSYEPPSRSSKQTGIELIDEPDITVGIETISPNTMQVAALDSIQRLRSQGKERALIISATGTGKTILSALDVQAVNPARMLFVAHREQILDRAISEFRRVLGGSERDFGKLAGSTREIDRKFVFATVQTLSKEDVLRKFEPSAFDYILIDEVHRAGASSFDRVLEHFSPKFLLGMTATPERTDDKNIFELFDYNVPFEIRLNSALELEMLIPFHYYGVADITFEDGVTTTEATSLGRLVATERVDHIVKALETYGQAGVEPRGLIFCSRKDEVHALSDELNGRLLHGRALRTIALTGDDSIVARENAVAALELGDLDYILTVDVFNEGIDIPTINQVIMLRQTQSSIIFVQQLGRGLRTAPGKEYLIVIDFIGNYANNFLIPIALFGDESLNRESLRKNLIAAEEVGVIAGLSSVRFDRIAQGRVLKSLETAKLDSFHNLKSAIETVRNRVGRIPLLVDFLRFESVDPVVLSTRLGNYPELLAKVLHEDTGLTLKESRMLTVVSKELLTAKRPQELYVLKRLLEGGSLTRDSISTMLKVGGFPAGDDLVASVIGSLTLGFNTASELDSLKAPGPAELTGDGLLRLDQAFAASYISSAAFAQGVDDLVEAGLQINSDRYETNRPFSVGRQYSRKDASRLLNWSSNMYSTIYGYRVDPTTSTCPIFVTLHKSEEVSASTAYEDQLVDPQTMLWYTKSKRNLKSPDVLPIVGNSVELHVFAKKDDAEGAGFYYLGLATSIGAEGTTMAGNEGRRLPVVRMNLHFDQAIDTALYDYFHATLTN